MEHKDAIEMLKTFESLMRSPASPLRAKALAALAEQVRKALAA